MTWRDAPLFVAAVLMGGALAAPLLNPPGWMPAIMALTSIAIAEGALLVERRRS